MTKEEKLAAIEETMELSTGTLKEDSVLADFDEWDSMTKLALVAESQRIFGRDLGGAELKACVTVSDLLKL